MSGSSEETIVSVLARHVASHPTHAIFRWVDKKAKVTSTLTYQALWENSLAVKVLLQSNKGIQRGDRVMIAYPFGLEFLAGLVGCMMAGMVGCSVYPPNPQRLQHDLPAFNQKVQDAGATFALTTASFKRFMMLNNFVGNRSEVTWIATDNLRAVRDTNYADICQLIRPDDVAFVQYTSGSTGFPKGVIISQRSLVTNTIHCAAVSNASEGQDFTAVSWMPQYHDMGLIGFFFTVIYSGVTGVVCSPLDFILQPTLWHDMVIKYRADTTIGPNFSFGLLTKRLLAAAKSGKVIEPWSFVRRVICAAEPVDPVVMNQVISVLGVSPTSLYIGYGLAEVGLAACFTQFEIIDGLVACGNTEGQSTIRIVNENKQLIDDQIVGEIYINAPNLVASGYWGKPNETRDTFANEIEGENGTWLATGDLGVIIRGKVFVTGRNKEVIIINGLNYFPVDIERTVENAYPSCIRPGCVAAYQHTDSSVGVLAELRKGFKKEDCPGAFDLVNLIAEKNQIPVGYLCLLRDHTIPKTTSGKLKRTEVRQKSVEELWPPGSIIVEWRRPQPVTEISSDKVKSIFRTRMSIAGTRMSNAIVAAAEAILQEELEGMSNIDSTPEDTGAEATFVSPSKKERNKSFLQRQFADLGTYPSDEFADTKLLDMAAWRSQRSLAEVLQLSDDESSDEPDEPGVLRRAPSNSQFFKSSKHGADNKGSGTMVNDVPGLKAIPPTLGSKYGTQCPFAGDDLKSFYNQHGSSPYYYCHVTEQATTNAADVVAELSRMEHRLENGEIERSYELAEHVFASDRFWTAVPGFSSKQFALAQDATVHKEYHPWLVSNFSDLPALDALRKELKHYIANQGESLSIDGLRKYVILTFYKLFASRSLSDTELSAFLDFQSGVLDMVMRPTPEASDGQLLQLKSAYLRDFIDRLWIDENMASALLDLLVFASMNLTSAIQVCLAVLFCENDYFDPKSFVVNEGTVLQFVWECLRLFPPQASVGWRENGVRHVAVIGMASLDPSIWGDDASEFKPDRCTAEEFSARSCLFAEQAGSYRCPAKKFGLDFLCAVLLEVKSGPWSCPTKVKSYASLPYFDPFVLTRLPTVVVVGGGVAGLVCALRLSERGVKVTLIEKNEVVGGHARHVEILGGHLRNPAFGAFVEGIYPNLMELIEELSLEKVFLCRADEFRQNLAFDRHQLEEANPSEVARFLSEMKVVYESGSGVGQTIGEYLDSHEYDEHFIVHFFVGKAIHFFAGLTIEEYLEIPLHLMAWFLVADMIEGPGSSVFRLRNKDYMDAFTAKLRLYGVEILTDVTVSKLIARDATGVRVLVGSDRVVHADKIVLAMPPNAVVEFLGYHLSPNETVLTQFDCRYETVILHQDPKWVISNSKGVLFGLMPEKKDPLPLRAATIPLTTSTYSDADGFTPIYSTHSYANYQTLPIDGAKEFMTFTHVRITQKTEELRSILLKNQGMNKTYFAGGWTRGFMLHEDAVVSGMEVANELLTSCGLQANEILPRKVDLAHSASFDPGLVHSIASPVLSNRKKHNADQMTKKGRGQLDLLDKSIFSELSNQTGKEVRLSDSIGSLGMTSLTISAVHASLHEKLGISDNELPVSLLFEGDKTVEELINDVASRCTHLLAPLNEEDDADSAAEFDDTITFILENEVGFSVSATDVISDLKLNTRNITNLQATLSGIVQISIPIAWFFEGGLSVRELIDKISALSRAKDVSNNASHQYMSSPQIPRYPYVRPFSAYLTAIILQFFAVLCQPLFLGISAYPGVLFVQLLFGRMPYALAIVLTPLSLIIFAITAALLLILVKWIFVGRQTEGYSAIWSSRFTSRWVVKQLSQLVWKYTLWRVWGGTAAMNVLHRLLGCSVGRSASIEPGCIQDYDLVVVGRGTFIGEGTIIDTENVSLGVQTLSSVVLGCDCVINVESHIEGGSTLEDNVHLAPRTVVPSRSKLEKDSHWHGTPAEIVDDGDIEVGNNSATLDNNSTNRRPSRHHYESIRVMTFFLLAPCLYTVEYGILFLFGSLIFNSLGSWGLGALIWVPPTAVWVLNILISVGMKRLLIGKVKPGAWPRWSSFEAKKMFIDHLIKDHLLFWQVFARNTGSFPAWSSWLERQILRSLGVKIGEFTSAVSPRIWTSYDLVSIGRCVTWGAMADVFPWLETRDNLVGNQIIVNDQCFVGAYAHIVGEVELGLGSTVAASSIASTPVKANQTVIGTKIYNTVLEEAYTVEWSFLRREQANAIGSFILWIGATSFTLLLFIVAESPVYAKASSVVDPSFLGSLVLGISLGLVIPIVVIILLWFGKAITVGIFTIFEAENGSLRNVPIQAFEHATLTPLLPYIWQAFGGTYIETCFWLGMGAQIGSDAYLDSVKMWEADLVTIGNSCSLRGCRLTAHQVSRSTHSFNPVTVGDRCALSVNAVVNGQVVLENDTELLGGTRPLSGSRVKSGVWVGYPAKRVGDATTRPHPPNPVWSVLCFNPLSALIGGVWLVVWNLRYVFRRCSRKRVVRPFGADLPEAFQGVFECGECLLALHFDASQWIPDQQQLRIKAGTYMTANDALGSDWWDFASYDFAFQGSNFELGIGWVILGWWRIPKAIVTAKLVRRGNGWEWSHSWFNGAPSDKLLFSRPPIPIESDETLDTNPGWSWPEFSSISSKVSHESVAIGGGQILMHCVLAGSGRETPVLLLHGFPEVSYSWAPYIDALTRSGRRRLIIPDLRGFGETRFTGDVEDWTVSRTVADLIEMLDYFDIPKVILVAHDYGAITAWAMQKLHPGRVSALASIGFADVALAQIGGEPEYPGQPPCERVSRKRSRGESPPVSYVLDFASIAKRAGGLNSRHAFIGLYQLENSTIFATANTERDEDVLPADLLLVLEKCAAVNPISHQLIVHKNTDNSYLELETILDETTVYPDFPVLIIACGKDKAWTPELVRSAQVQLRYPDAVIRHEEAFFHYCLNQKGAQDRLRVILAEWLDSL